VRSHFAIDPAASLKNREMLRRVADLDTIVVGSEAEALLLEANLIKEHRPRFNIQLRDDKRYPYIKVTLQESFPRVYVTRRLENDGGRYFGPYTEVGAMRQALEVVKRLYTVRSCRYDLPDPRRRRGPASTTTSAAAWRRAWGCRARRVPFDDRRDPGVLGGRTAPVRARVRATCSRLRRRWTSSGRPRCATCWRGWTLERRQRALDVRGGDTDVIGLARDGDQACACCCACAMASCSAARWTSSRTWPTR
jgi:excinuclease ABC subunit C